MENKFLGFKMPTVPCPKLTIFQPLFSSAAPAPARSPVALPPFSFPPAHFVCYRPPHAEGEDKDDQTKNPHPLFDR